MRILILALLLAGCPEGTFDTPFTHPPRINQVLVTVVWTDKTEIEKRCNNAHAYACATVGTADNPFSTIWAIKPNSFNHAPLVEALGHELLHSLGATH